ncbi:MAG: 16S rRNA (uracil(1498)-N(3))-methyltransferase [Deltaproteobacteria bacterium]|nr:16S rRNA (uracil(1498)-N(3))-methyltransferase [Deltaproteobacteria bacterium]
MRRFFIEEIKERGNTCIISGAEAKHITRVLRMGRRDRFILMDGKGARFQAVIDSAGRQEVLVTLEKPLPAPPHSPVDITLCQSLLKSRPMDFVIQKTSELGVDHIFPFSSERTVTRLDDNRSANRVRHWREIARSATKQSDRVTPAEIVPLSSLMNLTGQWKKKDALKVILWEEEDSKDLKGLLRASSPAKHFIGIVGPEGGFSREEVEIVNEAGFISVSMGRRILRAETAAITMVAIVQYEWGDLSLNEK